MSYQLPTINARNLHQSNGQSKTIILIGTCHSLGMTEGSAADRAFLSLQLEQLLPGIRAITAVVIEKPLQEINAHDSFDVGKTKAITADHLHNWVLDKYTDEWKNTGCKFVGIDGRKIWVANRQTQQPVMDISLKRKGGEDFTANVVDITKASHSGELLGLAADFIDCCFRNDQKQLNNVVDRLKSLLEYRDGTDLPLVLRTVCHWVYNKAAPLDPAEKEIMKHHLVNSYHEIVETEKADLAAQPEILQAQIKAVNQEAKNKLQELGFSCETPEDIASAAADPDFGVHYYLDIEQEVQARMQMEETKVYCCKRIMDGFFQTICCDLPLSTEILASSENTFVVAFGKMHTDLLDRLISSCNANTHSQHFLKYKKEFLDSFDKKQERNDGFDFAPH